MPSTVPEATSPSRPLTVIVDARMARRRRTGTATYITGLVDALRRTAPPNVRIRTVSGPPPLPRRGRLTRIGNLVLDLAWTHVALPLIALRHRADVIHAPFNWAPALAPCPTVATVHDLAWERVPETFPGFFRRYARIFTRLTTRRARRLITVSTATADDLATLYGAARDRIRVIPNGVVPDPAPTSGPRDPIVLAVGEFEPRKRIMELVAGFARYRNAAPEDPPPCDLVLVGSGGSQAEEVAAAAGDHVTLTGFVDDAELIDLYRRATLLVFPSSYEGFGLPVAEAMAHGCPALVAQNSALVEVGGEAAIPLTDPTTEGIATALTTALADRDSLAARGERSRDHARRFDWDTIARATLDVYREAS